MTVYISIALGIFFNLVAKLFIYISKFQTTKMAREMGRMMKLKMRTSAARKVAEKRRKTKSV